MDIRKPRVTFKAAVFLCFFCLSSVQGVAHADSCDDASSWVIGVEMKLKSSKFDAVRRVFIGTFEIRNVNSDSSFSYGVFRRDGVEYVGYPGASVQFLDLNDRWVDKLEIPGSFRRPPYLVSLAPGSKRLFDVQLVDQETANKNASKFRLLLRSKDSKQCVQSVPFEGYPKRINVDGFKTPPISP